MTSRHRSCWTHRHVWHMTCAEYDALHAWADNRCGICGATDRPLNIDHDHALGPAAIRGLLCVGCNPGVMRSVDRGHRAPDERVTQYLNRSWHLTHNAGGAA